jgi:hypothetical protein
MTASSWARVARSPGAISDSSGAGLDPGFEESAETFGLGRGFVAGFAGGKIGEGPVEAAADGLENFLGAIAALVAADETHLAEFLEGGRRLAGEIDERGVLGDHAAGAVEADGGVFAPGGEFAQDGEFAAREAGEVHAEEEILRGGFAVEVGAGEGLAFLADPGGAAEALEVFLEVAADGHEVAHVVEGVFELLAAERPAGPVGELLALVERDAGDAFDEVAVGDLAAVAEEGGGDLGVEDVVGDLAGHFEEDFEVAAAGVDDDFDGGVEEKIEQGIEAADFERIDDGFDAVGGDLDHAELAVVAAFTDELGVHGDGAGFAPAGAGGFQGVLGSDQHGQGILHVHGDIRAQGRARRRRAGTAGSVEFIEGAVASRALGEALRAGREDAAFAGGLAVAELVQNGLIEGKIPLFIGGEAVVAEGDLGNRASWAARVSASSRDLPLGTTRLARPMSGLRRRRRGGR